MQKALPKKSKQQSCQKQTFSGSRKQTKQHTEHVPNHSHVHIQKNDMYTRSPKIVEMSKDVIERLIAITDQDLPAAQKEACSIIPATHVLVVKFVEQCKSKDDFVNYLKSFSSYRLQIN